ncbi:MAG: hypothetical protein ACPLYF_01480 [Fervidobacterium sp.]
MKIYSITSDNKFKEYTKISFQDEHQEAILEDWLASNPDKIIEDGNLLIIGRQVTTNLGSFIDLLAVDRQGDLVVIELKRDRTPRETLAQALEYASFTEKLGYEQLDEIFRSYLGDEALNLAQYHREYFSLVSDEAVVFNNDQRIVIVGQSITPEIRQTSTFLRNKGIRVTCLEFTFFKAEGGLRLLSTSIVVGNESKRISKVSSGSLPTISESAFFSSVDSNGKLVFEKLLIWANSNSFPIHWGTKGFSLNVNLSGTHVAFCFGYPPSSVYQQSIYSALFGRGGLLSKIDIPDQELQSLYTEAQTSSLFQPAGRELKCLINHKFSERELDLLFSWLTKVTQAIEKHGLKGQGESQS